MTPLLLVVLIVVSVVGPHNIRRLIYEQRVQWRARVVRRLGHEFTWRGLVPRFIKKVT